MKKIIITGNVGGDPELRYAPSGDSFVTFSLAVTTGSKANQKTDWLEISCNGKTAEIVQQYVKKGSKLLIEGTPSTSAYINKEGKPVATLRVSAHNIEFIGSGSSNDSNNNVTYQPIGEGQVAGFNAPGAYSTPRRNLVPQQAPATYTTPGPTLTADDIPF